MAAVLTGALASGALQKKKKKREEGSVYILQLWPIH
jgi:hypothetical protein